MKKREIYKLYKHYSERKIKDTVFSIWLFTKALELADSEVYPVSDFGWTSGL